MDEKIDSTDKLLCALSYPIPLIGVLLLLTKKENRTCRYHGFNSVFFGLAVYILFFVLGILYSIPIIGWILAGLGGLFWLAYIIYAIFLAIETHNGKFPVIPVVTDFARKYIDNEV